MINEIEKKTVNKSGDFERISVGISEEKMGYVLEYLQNKMYNNKPLAVIREYVCNAIDEHVLSGVNRPIKLSLPTKLNQTFSVRDFGRGLTKDEVYNVYGQYFESSKDQRNDMIGAFGSGSKAAYSISDSFTVTSWNGGIKSVYIFSIEGSGSDNRSYVNRVYSGPSNEDSGIEVSVPVRESYIDSFEYEAKKIIPWLNEIKPIECNLEIPEPNIFAKVGENLRVLVGGENKGINVNMGGVVYKLERDKVILDQLDKCPSLKRAVSNFNLVIYVPIGSVSLGPSRENIELTPKTYNYLEKLFVQMDQELFDYVSAKLNESQDPYARRILLKESQKLCREIKTEDNVLPGELLLFDGYGREISPNSWKSKAFNYYGIPVKSSFTFEGVHLCRTTRYGNAYKVSEENHLVLTSKSTRIKDVLFKIKENVKGKITCYVFSDKDSLDKFVNHYGLDKVSEDYITNEDGVEKIRKSLPKPERAKADRSGVQHNFKIRGFSENLGKIRNSFCAVNVDDNTEGLFMYANNGSSSEANISTGEALVNYADKLNFLTGQSIYILNKNTTVPKKLKHISDGEYIKKLIENKIKSSEFKMEKLFKINGSHFSLGTELHNGQSIKEYKDLHLKNKQKQTLEGFMNKVQDLRWGSILDDAQIKYLVAVSEIKKQELEKKQETLNKKFELHLLNNSRKILSEMIDKVKNNSYYYTDLAAFLVTLSNATSKELVLI